MIRFWWKGGDSNPLPACKLQIHHRREYHICHRCRRAVPKIAQIGAIILGNLGRSFLGIKRKQLLLMLLRQSRSDRR
jgi:hypothetical protein